MAQEVNKMIDENIDPSEIVLDDDSDMPVPETKIYEQLLLVTDKFVELFTRSTGSMPYTTEFKNKQSKTIKLIDLVKFVESHISTGFTINEMNTVLSFISTAEFRYVRPLMEVVEDSARQKELWQLSK